jgi:hypothetical protein
MAYDRDNVGELFVAVDPLEQQTEERALREAESLSQLRRRHRMEPGSAAEHSFEWQTHRAA